MRSVVMVWTLLLAPMALGAGSGGMSGDSGGGNMVRRTPAQMEASSYNAGLNHKKRAAHYEEKALSAKNEKERAKLLAKAQGQYRDAIDDYKKALGYNDRSYQACNELGYAYRKLGDYETAIRAYDAALSLQADFAPAIEYRAEAYLALGRFADVKGAYLLLFRTDQDQAATLMRAMDAWYVSNSGDASGDARAFAEWVVERKAVAAQTQSLSMENTRNWH